MAGLSVGDKAPDFELVTDQGEPLRLSALHGSPVVLYFYPEDDTEGCTIENIEFSALMLEFQKLGVRVVGISPDTVEKHCEFRDKYDLGVTLAADPEKQALMAYGVWGEKKTFGHVHIGVHRTSVLVAPDGTIAAIFAVRRIRGHAQAVLGEARRRFGPRGAS